MSESQNIEYKSSWYDDYLILICGFANTQAKYFSFNFITLQQ